MGVHFELLESWTLEMRMILVMSLVILPALVLGNYEIPAPKPKVDFQAVCDFHNKEIDKLEQSVKKLAKDVDLESELYGKLNELKSVCGTLAYRVLPYCATKEGMNVLDKVDDECAETRANIMKNSFQKMMKLDKPPAGKEIFRICKDIAAKGLLEQFKKMQGLVSSLCGESQSGSSRRKRSYDDGYGYYPEDHGDPSAYWFQYQLRQEEKMLDPEVSCYFFTQGWNQVDYGQYYLYQNTLDSDVTIPDISIPDISIPDIGIPGDKDDLLKVALLSDIGTQDYHDEGYPAYYPDQGYPAYYPDKGYPAYPSYTRHTGGTESVTAEDEIEMIDETLDDIPLVETLPVSAPAEKKLEEKIIITIMG